MDAVVGSAGTQMWGSWSPTPLDGTWLGVGSSPRESSLRRGCQGRSWSTGLTSWWQKNMRQTQMQGEDGAPRRTAEGQFQTRSVGPSQVPRSTHTEDHEGISSFPVGWGGVGWTLRGYWLHQLQIEFQWCYSVYFWAGSFIQIFIKFTLAHTHSNLEKFKKLLIFVYCNQTTKGFWVIVEDRGAWHTTVHGVTKSPTQLRNWTTTPPKSSNIN